MSIRRPSWLAWTFALACFGSGSFAAASQDVQDPPPQAPQETEKPGPQKQSDAKETPALADEVQGFEHLDGFLPLHFDPVTATLWMEIARFDEDLLWLTGLAAGLGSNDIGLDRGQMNGERLVRFRRIGKKVLMIQPNLRFRASSTDPAERRTVEDAFAPSVLFAFDVAAETDGRVLVDLTNFLLRDATRIAPRLRPGSYQFDAGRSAIHRDGVLAFPKNVEMEVLATFVRSGDAAAGGGGGGASSFAGVGDVAASADAATLRVHHSFVALPDDGYEPRDFDPRSGYFALEYDDYTAPLGTPLRKRLLVRHRIEKKDPAAPRSEPVEPIVYYLDRGTPEPMRSALLEGARWWNQAFEAAGYVDAFRVELLPEGVHSLDVRYNVIHWVHRSTRGWSYGGTITDPRTGEILKGVVTLGSLRVRQDYLIAEGLLSPYADGTETPPELEAWALARLRQLAAHEVGHTLGLVHQYYDSSRGRISVMDYPHPLVTLCDDGSFDLSQVYDVGIGEWDEVAIAYGYQDFPAGADEAAELRAILARGYERDLRLQSNQDIEVSPRADQWSNGNQPAVELRRMLAVRAAALARFGEHSVKRGLPWATLEEGLVPLYLHHRYQVEATASALGGIDYSYTLRGDGLRPFTPVSGAEQRDALSALLEALDPQALALPRALLALLPPRPLEYDRTRELFPRHTGLVFDALAPAEVATALVLEQLFAPERAARIVQQHALDPELPGLLEVTERVLAALVRIHPGGEAVAEIARRQLWQYAGTLERLAGSPVPTVRAVAESALDDLKFHLVATAGIESTDTEAASRRALRRELERWFARPAETASRPSFESAPPGAPIGAAAASGGFDAAFGPAGAMRELEQGCGCGEALHVFDGD